MWSWKFSWCSSLVLFSSLVRCLFPEFIFIMLVLGWQKKFFKNSTVVLVIFFSTWKLTLCFSWEQKRSRFEMATLQNASSAKFYSNSFQRYLTSERRGGKLFESAFLECWKVLLKKMWKKETARFNCISHLSHYSRWILQCKAPFLLKKSSQLKKQIGCHFGSQSLAAVGKLEKSVSLL